MTTAAPTPLLDPQPAAAGEPAGAVDRVLGGRWAVAAGAALAVLLGATLLPWTRSGSVARNAYASASAIQPLGADGPAGRAALLVWLTLPALIGVAGVVLVVAPGRPWRWLRRTAVSAAAGVGLVGAGVALVASAGPAGATLVVPLPAAVASSAAVAALVAAWWPASRRSR